MEKRHKISVALLRVTPWLPFVPLFWFIVHYGVNVPFLDEWGFANRLSLLRSQPVCVYLQSTWWLNNEHRIFFPNLIWTVFALTTKWNRVAVMIFDAVLGMLTFLAIYRIASKQRSENGLPEDGLFYFSLFLSSLALSSWVQWENWLWGHGLPFILPQTCVAFAVFFLCSDGLTLRRFVYAALCCFVASYSAAHGLCAWLAVLPCLVAALRKNQFQIRTYTFNISRTIGDAVKSSSFSFSTSPKTLLRLWLALFIAATVLYFYGFHRAIGPGMGDLRYSFRHPLAALNFSAALLGAPLAQGYSLAAIKLSPIIGWLVLAALLVCLYRLRALLLPAAAPWLSLVLYGIGFVCMATFARSEFIVMSQMSRYTSMTIFVVIGVIQLSNLVFLQSSRLRFAGFVAGSVLLVTLLISSVAAITPAQQIHDSRLLGRLCLEIVPFVEPSTDSSSQGCLYNVLPLDGHAVWARDNAKSLNSMGMQRIVYDAKFIENPAASAGSLEGFSEPAPVAVKKGDFIVAWGWLVFQNARKMPPIVLISYDDQKTFIAAGLVETPNVPHASASGQSLKARWQVRIPAEFLPEGESTVKAWAYNRSKGEFIKLTDSQGEKKIEVYP